MLHQYSCHRYGSLLLFVHCSLFYSQGNTRIKHVKRNVCSCIPHCNSKDQISQRRKNETAIIVITGLRNGVVGKTERKESWQFFHREEKIVCRRRDSGWLSIFYIMYFCVRKSAVHSLLIHSFIRSSFTCRNESLIYDLKTSKVQFLNHRSSPADFENHHVYCRAKSDSVSLMGAFKGQRIKTFA